MPPACHVSCRMHSELLAVLLGLAGIGSGAGFGFDSFFGDAGNGTGFGTGFFFGPPVNPAGSASQSDARYLVLKVDLVSSLPPNSSLIEPLLAEARQLLETGFSTDAFQLTWVEYEAGTE